MQKLGLTPTALEKPLTVRYLYLDCENCEVTGFVQLRFSLEPHGEMHERKFYVSPALTGCDQEVLLGIQTLSDLGLILFPVERSSEQKITFH